MGLKYHPSPGTIVICNFRGFEQPEMIKKRPAIVISPRFRERTGLCTVVPCSTTPPPKMQPYHFELNIDPPLPAPFSSPYCWVKADMVYTVSFSRLELPFEGKDESGKRRYDCRVLDSEVLGRIQECMLFGLGLKWIVDFLANCWRIAEELFT